MKDLKQLKENLELELREFTEPEESEEMGEEEKETKGNSKVRIETSTKIIGIIRKLDYEVDFKELADKVTDEVSGIVLTRAKAKQIFKIVKEMVGF